MFVLDWVLKLVGDLLAAVVTSIITCHGRAKKRILILSPGATIITYQNFHDSKYMSKPEHLATHYEALLEAVGEDISRDGLQRTPLRAAKAFQYLTRGYNQDLEEVVNGAIFESENDQMVIVKDIELYSLCEHHLLPFVGKAHIAYLPQGKVIGLSKLARITDMYARRLQIQENLTEQIARAIETMTGAAGVGVIVEAKHFCMMMRGVEKQNSAMKTSMMLGRFRTDHRTRTEFLTLVQG